MTLPSVIAWAVMLGGFAVLAWGAVAYRAIMNSRAWPSTSGVIASARVVEDPPSDAYVIRLTFQYVVAGATYRCERIQFGGDTRYGNAEEARLALEGSFAPAKEVRVFYSPIAPEYAVLCRGVSFNLAATLGVGGLLAVIGALLLLLP